MILTRTITRTVLFFTASAFAVPATASTMACVEGNVCAITCSKNKGNQLEVQFADFAKLGANGQVHREIIERLGYSPDEQIRQHMLELTEADRYSSDMLDSSMEHVKRTTVFEKITEAHSEKDVCQYETLAEYSPYKHAYVVNQDLYEKMNSTDRAGFWTRLALSHLAGETDKAALSPEIPRLVTELFYGKEEDHDRIKLLKTAPFNKSDKLETLRALLKDVVPQPQEDSTAENSDDDSENMNAQHELGTDGKIVFDPEGEDS